MALMQGGLVSESDVGDEDIADLTASLEDQPDEESTRQEAVELNSIVAYVRNKWQRARDARLDVENRMLTAYRNYCGQYGPDTVFRDNERSKVFIKITKTKVLAAYGQLCDVVFAGNQFPIGVEPSPIPEGIAENVYIDPSEPAEQEPKSAEPVDPYGYEGDGREFPKGATHELLLGPLADKLEGLDVKEGIGSTPTAVTFEPAAMAAKAMEKTIMDQLDECSAEKQLRYVLFECALFGTGIMAVPITYDKEYPRWDEEGEYKPVIKTLPKIEARSVWDYYPDPDAVSPTDRAYDVIRHRYTRSDMRALKRRPGFRANAIEVAISNGYNYTKEWWEDNLRSDQEIQMGVERFEVLEYWGILDKELAEEAGIDLPEEYEDIDEVSVNLWTCGDQILRAVMNPYKPNRIPYLAVPYEINPYSPFGIGVADNMTDTQLLMNGFMRLAVDNAVISGNSIFEVDEQFLTPGQDLKMSPGKVIRRQGGGPGQAITAIKLPNTTNENLLLFDKARQLSDESTGIPSISHGQNAGGAGRTAAGMSMLMGAATVSIKTVIKNLDDYLLRPLGEALFAWNMQFNRKKEIVGDLQVVARGTESLMQNEVKSQRLMQFLQVAGGVPTAAKDVKFSYLLRQIATTMGLDPDKILNSPEEAMRQALMMQMMGGGTASMGSPDAGVSDMTGGGGGNIGVGAAPQPGEAQFAGAPPQGNG